ncbi:MAG TPA: methyltransferase domain-containing protein [Mycobacteriales bacterium]|nr:methyltransferase domain-containing protein [Mycobacteriales bacterium]
MTDYALTISDAEIRRYQLMAEKAQAVEAQLWESAGIIPGATVVDVGCGPAAVSVVLARAVGPSGRIVGVERDEASLAAARQVVADSGVSNVELRPGTATDTGLPSGSADVVMCRNVLAHNGPDEQAIVNHLADLSRVGGVVYLVDVDATAMRMLDADPELADLSDHYLEFHGRHGNDLQTGLRLAKLLAAAGLEVLEHRGTYNILAAPPGLRPPPWAAREAMLRDGVITAEDVDRWQRAFERMDDATTRPTIFAPQFVAYGRKPG